MSGGSFGLRTFVLSAAITQLVGANIPDFYRAHDFFAEGDQVCNRDNAGARADIYCRGRILEAVMAFRLFNDSKTFVDLPLAKAPEDIITAFESQFPTDDDITRDAINEFVETNFVKDSGKEMEECDLPDWTEKPELLVGIKDDKLREFALSVNGIWKRLCRRFKKEVAENPDRFSLIYVPGKFIVPGGRFREYYYWDSFWIIKGLLASGMYETTRSVLLNFVHIVNTVGFIPNGGRIYYLARSQPPMLIPMFYEYLEATGDFAFVEEHLPTLEKEFEFWNQRRNVSVQVGSESYQMYQYRAESNVPRPESYREDVELVKDVESWNDKAMVWKNLASAAEAGYDFSSRWFQNYTELASIDTTNIVEVDLNSFMCWNMEILSHFYSKIQGGEEKEKTVFWVDKEDGWYDFNLREKKNNIEFYPSNVAPFFTRCYDSLDHLKSERVYQKLKTFGAFGFNSGIPTSLHKNTGQQWDSAEFSWPPLEHMIIDGLRRSESPRLQEYAYEIAKVWIRVNYNTFNRTGVFWEKYDVDGQIGSGGEYVVQAGFGWTNGVVLDLLVSYANRLDFNSIEATDNSLPISTEALTRAKRFVRMPGSNPTKYSRARRFFRAAA
ncbi:Trehalase [Aphelenchoides bicaudatus]|nr:Trehalase [Aphelenchoides bicaudatus]